jgi:hypothetical protein
MSTTPRSHRHHHSKWDQTPQEKELEDAEKRIRAVMEPTRQLAPQQLLTNVLGDKCQICGVVGHLAGGCPEGVSANDQQFATERLVINVIKELSRLVPEQNLARELEAVLKRDRKKRRRERRKRDEQKQLDRAKRRRITITPPREEVETETDEDERHPCDQTITPQREESWRWSTVLPTFKFN